MKKTLFADITEKFFPSIDKVIEQVNGKRGTAPKYLHEEMLRLEYSPTQTWSNASVNTTYVAADIVDMDSPLPIKRRDSIAQATGTLPTVGMKLWLGGKQINDINVMIAQGMLSSQVASKVLNDAVRCTNGVKERLEICFLQGLSEGVCLVPDEQNTGVGVRLNFNYLAENSYGVVKPWGEEGALPISDLARVLSANPNITTIMLSKEAYNTLRQSMEAKTLTASYMGVASLNKETLAVPTPTKFNEAFKDEYGVDFHIVDRTIYVEKNGIRSKVRPWNRDKVIFLVDKQVGALVYGRLPEETNPVEGVAYSKPTEYALLSKYSMNDPLREFTAIQGIVAPIIENVDQIYSLDITSSEVLDEAKETEDSDDSKITVWGKAYKKPETIKALSTILGRRVNTTIGDEKLLMLINELNDEQEAELKTALTEHTA